MPFIIIGMSIIGGILVLWAKSDSENTTKLPADPNTTKNPSGDFDVEKLRAARREIRKQTRLKNKKNTSDPTSGEEE